MEIDKIMAAGMQAFKQKFMAFCENRDFSALSPESSEAMIGGLKGALAAGGIAALKCYVETYDSSRDVINRDGVVYRFKCLSPKLYLTPFGEVEIFRRLYQPDRGGECYVPLDRYWGMTGEYATVDVREAIVYSVAHNTPEEAARLFEKCALFHPSATAVKHVVEKTGEFFELHREVIQERIISEEKVPKGTEAVVASLDGANVLLNERGEGRGRPAERPQSSEAAGYLSHYRNAMVGSISFYGEATEDGPERLESRYVARMPEEKAVVFRRDMETELAAVLSKSSDNVRKVLLMDGHRALWNYARSVPLYSDFEPLIDFYHTTEHLSKASEALFGKGSKEGVIWYQKHRENLLEEKDAALGVIRSMDYYAKTLRLSKGRKKDLRMERTFFVRQKRLMKYPNFRRRGLPIGSGPVEAACKSLVKTRMCRSGMRWSIDGGQKILTFRTLVKSGRWDSSWEIYKELRKAA